MRGEEKRSFLKELKNGSHKAYKKLHNLYGKEIFGYIRSYFPFDHSTAEDVFQEVFITAYIKINSLKEVDKLRSWLYKIASRKSIDYKRKKAVEKKYMKEYGEQINILKYSSVEEQVIRKELFQVLNLEVSKLPNFLRDVYILRQYQNLPYKEIVDITETSLSRVKKAMKKAVQELLKQLKKKNIDKEILLK